MLSFSLLNVLPIRQRFVDVSWLFAYCIVSSCSLYTCLLSKLSCYFSLPHRALLKGTKSTYKPSREEYAALLQLTQSALEQLQSEVCVDVAGDACSIIELSRETECPCKVTTTLSSWSSLVPECHGSNECDVLLSVNSWTMRLRALASSHQAHCVWWRVTFSSWWLLSAMFTKQTWERTAAETPPASAQGPMSLREHTNYCCPATRYSHIYRKWVQTYMCKNLS